MTATPPHSHPRVLLVDMNEKEAEVLTEAGYRVERGTFGPVVAVGQQPNYLPLPATGDLPDYREQEVVVVDCAPPKPKARGPVEPPPGQKWLWQHAGEGYLDPRPWAMIRHRAGLNRIYDHGGIFICFVAPKFIQDFSFVETEWEAAHQQGREQLNTWGFLSLLADVEATQDHGQEIATEPVADKIPGLKGALETASFTATMEPSYRLEDRWVPLAKNKYGQTVSAFIGREEDTKQGLVFLLPRLSNRAQFLKRLMNEALPLFAPSLFPHVKQGAWTKQSPYELPGIAEVRAQIESVDQEAEAKKGALRGKINERREEHGFLHDLLTQDDDELVAAVQRTLELLGFKDVRDVDAEAEDKKSLREDLQVWDREPILIAEVKGIGGLPRESDALQVTKYIAPRMKQWKKAAQGLTVINHQMTVEGLSREQEKVFQKDVVTNAEEHEFGLLTTWDLFRLARAYLRHGWKHELVADLFYRHGRIEPIPTHYEPVGTVNQFFEQAEALTVDLTAEIKVGDVLAYELSVEFEQEEVKSLHLDDESVEQAEAGVEVGVKTDLSKDQARKGVRVFKVKDGGAES